MPSIKISATHYPDLTTLAKLWSSRVCTDKKETWLYVQRTNERKPPNWVMPFSLGTPRRVVPKRYPGKSGKIYGLFLVNPKQTCQVLSTFWCGKTIDLDTSLMASKSFNGKGWPLSLFPDSLLLSSQLRWDVAWELNPWIVCRILGETLTYLGF